MEINDCTRIPYTLGLSVQSLLGTRNWGDDELRIYCCPQDRLYQNLLAHAQRGAQKTARAVRGV